MYESALTERKKIAFALGGLAGANAHGMGFLQAARKLGVEPDLVSCTSGMIYWFWRWLEKKDLEAELKAAIAAAAPFPIPAVNWWYTLTQGLAGVFRPAQQEFWRRLFSLPVHATMDGMLDRLLPAQMWVPTRPKADFESIAACFNAWPKPIFFNSFSPRSGNEYLHMNPPARTLYDRQQQRREKLRPHRHHDTAARLRTHVPEVVPADIDAAAVDDALWLTWYGFDRPDGRVDRDRKIDGAYARQFILSELSAADILFMARPQGSRFLGALPGNYFAVQDLQTELWFNGSYTQQLARIDLMNRLVHNGALASDDYHEVKLVPVEIEVQRGYFAYFVEGADVFHRAVTESTRIFHQHLLAGQPAAGGNGKAPATPSARSWRGTGDVSRPPLAAQPGRDPETDRP
jgi:hypothetical protein